MTTQSSSVSGLRPSLFLYQSAAAGKIIVVKNERLCNGRVPVIRSKYSCEDCCIGNQTGNKNGCEFQFLFIFIPRR